MKVIENSKRDLWFDYERKKLLSFEDTHSFIFLIVLLKEGWDNPNVFLLPL